VRLVIRATGENTIQINGNNAGVDAAVIFFKLSPRTEEGPDGFTWQDLIMKLDIDAEWLLKVGHELVHRNPKLKVMIFGIGTYCGREDDLSPIKPLKAYD
jgi:hypothetical protein